MVDTLRIDTAVLTATFLEAILYGIFTVLFFACVYVLWPLHRRTAGYVNVPLLVTAVALFLLATAHVAVCFSRVLDAFILGVDGSAQAYFNNPCQWKEVFSNALYVTLTLVGDSILIYRCWIIWSRSLLVVIFPVIMLLGTAVTGYNFVFGLLQLSQDIWASRVYGWITSFFTLSLALNIVTTALIVVRIWRSNLDVSKFGHQTVWPVIAVVLESGAIYSTSLFVLLMVYASGSNAQYIVLAMIDPIVGISFSLIIVRVGLNRISNSIPPPEERHSGKPSQSLRRILDRMSVITISRQVDVEQGDDDEKSDCPVDRSSKAV